MGDGAEEGPEAGRKGQGRPERGPPACGGGGGGGAEAARLEGSRRRSCAMACAMICGMARNTDLPCERQRLRQVIDGERDHVGEIPNQTHSSHLQ